MGKKSKSAARVSADRHFYDTPNSRVIVELRKGASATEIWTVLDDAATQAMNAYHAEKPVTHLPDPHGLRLVHS